MVSVVIPVFNVAKYLSVCLDSILNQTFKNLDIILVDDGSTDSCPQICDEYAMIDSRITVIHQENGGLSEARNTGINVAKGEYITFVDSDDMLDTDMIDYLYRKLIEYDADLVQCQLSRIDEEGNVVGKYTTLSDVLVENNHACMKTMLSDLRFNTTAWAKLYKTTMFKDVRYPKGKYNEDVFTTYKIVAQCERMFIGCQRKYFYRIRSGSIMLEPFKPKHMDGLDGKLEQCKFIEERYPDLTKYAHADIVYALNIRSMHMAKSGVLYNDFIDRMQCLYRLYVWNYFWFSSSKFVARLFSVLAYINLNVVISTVRLITGKNRK